MFQKTVLTLFLKAVCVQVIAHCELVTFMMLLVYRKARELFKIDLLIYKL